MAGPRPFERIQETSGRAARLPAFACAGASCLLLLTSCGRSPEPAAPEDLRVSISMGIRGTWRPNCWTELRFDVHNDAEDFEGEATVRALRGDGKQDPVVYRSSLEVPRGGRRRLSLPVLAGEWDAVILELRSPSLRRGVRFDLPTKLGDFSNTIDILIVGRRLSHAGGIAEGLESHLDSLRNKVYLRREVRNDSVAPPVEVTSNVTFVSERELPSHRAAYDPFRLVVIYESSLAAASDEELGALARWVERGGALVAFPGAEWSAGLPPRFASLLGVETIEADHAMPAELSQRLGVTASAGIYRRLVPAPGATVTDDGLALTRRPGTGFARTFSFTPERAALERSESLAPFAEALEPAYAHAATFSGNFSRALEGTEENLAGILLGMTGFEFPSFGALFLALIVYLGAGFFFPMWVFKKLGRREWTFAAIALAACLATWGIYRWGLVAGVSAGELEEISIVRPHRSGGGAEVTSLVACIAPSYRRVDLSLPEETRAPGSASLARPVRPDLYEGLSQQEPRLLEASAELRAAGDGSLEPPPFALYPSSPMFFRFDYAISDVPFVGIARRETAEGTVLEVENRGRRPLRMLYVTGDAALADEIAGRETREVRWPDSRDSRWDSPAKALGYDEDDLYPWGHWEDNWEVLAAGTVFERAAWSVVGVPEISYGPFFRLSAFYRAPLDDEPRALLLWSLEPTFPGGGEFSDRKALTIAVVELEPLESLEGRR